MCGWPSNRNRMGLLNFIKSVRLATKMKFCFSKFMTSIVSLDLDMQKMLFCKVGHTILVKK